MNAATFTSDDARKIFNAVIEEASIRGEADRVAAIELAREYFCSPIMRKAIEDAVWSNRIR